MSRVGRIIGNIGSIVGQAAVGAIAGLGSLGRTAPAGLDASLTYQIGGNKWTFDGGKICNNGRPVKQIIAEAGPSDLCSVLSDLESYENYVRGHA